MSDDEDTSGGEIPAASITVPNAYPVSLRGFDTEDHATQFGQLLGEYVRELSRYIDLSQLDGITVAYDYGQALLDLDRGYETAHRLTPSEELAVGVAMTPSVMRDGKIKSHIVLNGAIIAALENPELDQFGLSLHTLAHECAHVEVTHRFDSCFPGTILQKRYENAHHAFRWQIIIACWDEYAATWICASAGEDPTAGYEETFLLALQETRTKANNQIKAFRIHGKVDQILAEVYGAYGELIRFASYLLGTMAGKNLSLADLPKSVAALDGHWFSPYFDRLAEIYKAIAADYGKWSDLSAFELLGDLADQIVAEGGVIISYRPDGSPYADIPYTRQTM